MRRLVQFVYKHIHWLLFGVLVYLSILLIVNNNRFQRSKYLQVTREITGGIYSVTDRIGSYINLKSINAELSNQLAHATTEIHRLRLEAPATDSIRTAINLQPYYFISARVINNSLFSLENYMTLNKGTLDGIRPDMGVLSPSGVVGVVVNTSPHFSTVISLLNTRYRLNGKIKRNDYYGPLVWDGKDPHYSHLTEIPRYVTYEPGDTIVTSGYSTVFPEGVPIGSIVDAQRQRDDNYQSLRIRLFTNFSNLSEVTVVVNRLQEEQKELERQTLLPQTPY